MKTGKVMLGVLAGVAAGALLGILFAPEKGSVTRKKISKKSKDYTGAVKDKFNDFIEGVSGKIEKLNKDVSDFSERQNPEGK